jgi:hypothetical protein
MAAISKCRYFVVVSISFNIFYFILNLKCTKELKKCAKLPGPPLLLRFSEVFEKFEDFLRICENFPRFLKILETIFFEMVGNFKKI